MATNSAGPLAQALELIAAHHGRSVSAEALLSGLPLEAGRLDGALFPRAAGNAGLEAAAIERPLDELPALVFPCVLILAEGCAVLWAVDAAAGSSVLTLLDGEGQAPERQTMPLASLKARYSGYAFLLRPLPLAAGRSEALRLLDADHWFWSVVRRFWDNYLHIALAALVINVLALAFPLFTMVVYDRVIPNGAISSLMALSIGILIGVVFDVVLRIVRSRMIDMTGKQADVSLAADIFRQVMGLRMKARPQSVGQLANQIRDFDQVREFFTSATLVSASDILFALIFIGVMFLIAGPLGFIPLLLLPVVVGIGWAIQRPLNRAMRELQGEAAQRHGVLVEAVGNLETVKALGAEGAMQRKWERSVAATARAGEAVHLWSSLALTLTGAVQQLAQLGLIVWGVFLILSNGASVGALVAANMLIGRILSPLANIAAMMTRASQTAQSLRAIDALMQLEVERPPRKVFVARAVTEGAVEFRGVSFAYPGSKAPALDRVSFAIRGGERVGVIGRIGSGKTTIGRLLTGLYEPGEGQILVDGVDIRQYDPADIRAGVGFMLQDVQLFHGSLRENLTLGQPQASDEDVVNAARMAGVEDFVRRQAEGYDLTIAEGGRSLSGGQRQNIALARVLLRQPKILFMDEPTSALDLRSENEFCARLDSLLGRERTAIISTHRLSLLRFVDRLLVFEQGRLMADGPRDAVLEQLRKQGGGE